MNVRVPRPASPLREVAFDPELTPGARNAVNVCLRIQPGEKVTLITDEACKKTAASLASEAVRVGAPYATWVLEELAPRPPPDMPAEVIDDLERSQVSILAIQPQ